MKFSFAESAQEAMCTEWPIIVPIEVKKHVQKTWIQGTQSFT